MHRSTARYALLVTALVLTSGSLTADDSTFVVEIEMGPAWQNRNDVQIPNDESGTRFALDGIAGTGPWVAGRATLTWNMTQRSSLHVIAAPFSYTETGLLDEPVDFVGERYEADMPVAATYQFNSWRLGYRYRFFESDKWTLRGGGTLKVRDAKVELRQGETTSRDTDVGFVPLLSFGADYRPADRWHLIFDFEGLAGGPGRAFDTALKVGYDLNDRWSITGGYRLLEGGADTDDVYNFAWFNYVVVSGVYRF
jgi:hypothetical protein